MPAVELRNRTGEVVAVVLLDEEDVEIVSGASWSMSRQYPRCKREGKSQRLHNLLMPKRDGYTVDHINRDPLDNRRSNLRYLTHQENCQNRMHGRNTSGYIGVSRREGPLGIRWKAQININGKRTGLGYYSTPEEAALVYDIAARCYYGDHAITNAEIVQGLKSAA